MSIVPIKVPPGFYRNGTSYAAKGRWAGGNLVRWHDGSLRAIGGWSRTTTPAGAELDALYVDATVEHCRDIISWREHDGTKSVVFGTNKGLHYLDSSGTVSAVTVTGLPTDIPAIVGTASGYGVGPYGSETYGTPRSVGLSSVSPVFRWDFDLWGENLVMCPSYYEDSVGGRVGVWEYIPGDATASLIANAPMDVTGLVVTDERILMTIGNPSNPRLVQWSSREDNTDWVTTDITNEAGNYTLQGNGRLVSITKVLDQVLILSETDAHVAEYVGAPYIYGFRRVGDKCGPVHPAGVVVTDRFAVWPGRRNFFMYDGTLRPVECSVIDYLMKDNEGFNADLYSVIHGVDMREYNEIWWFYAPKSVSANADADTITAATRYVYFDHKSGEWGTGSLNRGASFNVDAADPPLMVDEDGYIYDHELEAVLVDGQATAYTGPLELRNGDVNMAVRRVLPDVQTTAGVRYALTGAQMPTDTEVQTETYDGSNPVPTRIMGREIRMQVYLDSVGQEIGPETRFDIAPAGTGSR